MYAEVISCGLSGIDGFPVTVETNITGGLPQFDVVGLPDASVRESRERVRAAMTNSGFQFPQGHVTANLAPADIKKEGPAFDLPIAVAILLSEGRLRRGCADGTCILGELALDGAVRPVRGALPMVISCLEKGIRRVMIPEGNLKEVVCVHGIDILPVSSLTQAAAHFSGLEPISPAPAVEYEDMLRERRPSTDFRYIKGQAGAKRALEIAAAGGHNVLLIGEPGSGKTLMARAMPTILPDMTFEEALETTRIHSAAGTLPETGLLVERPFRSPHHTASHASLVGGGASALPGEISKAHNGCLFLDELPEYRRDVLEALRQPLEDGFVTVTRVSAQSTYPARFILVCSMNPCPCGHLGSRTQQCRCSPLERRRYLNRISGPLLDRIDMHIEVESIPAQRLADPAEEEPSEAIRARVEQARAVQRERYKGTSIRLNSELDAATIDKLCGVTEDAHRFLLAAADKMKLSNRAFTRVLKVARTIADLAGREHIEPSDILEAVQFRAIDRKYWEMG